MTYVELVFFERIEENRGRIKNKKKFEPIICDILKYATPRWSYEALGLKRFGLTFIWEVATTLTHTEQELLMDEINSYNKVTIDLARTLFKKY